MYKHSNRRVNNQRILTTFCKTHEIVNRNAQYNVLDMFQIRHTRHLMAECEWRTPPCCSTMKRDIYLDQHASQCWLRLRECREEWHPLIVTACMILKAKFRMKGGSFHRPRFFWHDSDCATFAGPNPWTWREKWDRGQVVRRNADQCWLANPTGGFASRWRLGPNVTQTFVFGNKYLELNSVPLIPCELNYVPVHWYCER